jgi:nitrate reductase (NAD(P)H)
MMPNYHVGHLSTTSLKALAEGIEDENAIPASEREVFLDSRSWTTSILVSKQLTSWDTRLFSFALANSTQILGLPIGQHIMARLRNPVSGEAIIRSYTPISETDQKCTVDLLVKVYFDTPTAVGGKMTNAMDTIPIGHAIEFKGPTGKFTYFENGRCSVNGAERSVKQFVMICGGTGITPIFQVLRAIMRDPSDTTKCSVINGNRLEEDILCRDELAEFGACSTGRCKLVHTLTKGSDTWTGLRGRIGLELLEKEVGRYVEGSDSMVLICGPHPLEETSKRHLEQLGWSESNILFF